MEATAKTTVAKEDYTAVDVRELVMKESAFKGQRVRLSGSILDCQSGNDSSFLLMHVPAMGQAESGEEIIATYQGHLERLPRGTKATLWGVSDGLQIITQARCCGITVRPQIKVEILEW